ncbi:MAG: cytochrome c biogenesis protein CcsA [Proteobacteria bacterium]|jgi:ABC-type uncharacterized transport system permease subunit|nr:cytochrome c biogenesis protein CcsA [Pseudomonadota bacterium]MDA1300633.1 cytochrome c biogenesis protein CcsA [Pseudomonadota bacterium]
MSPVIPGSVAILLYLVGAGIQFRAGQHRSPPVVVLATLGIVLHGLTSWLVLVTEQGLDLGLYPMLSLSMLMVAIIVLLSSLRRPVHSLFIVIFPICAVTIALELLLQGAYTPRDITGSIGLHITLSIVAYGLLAVAAMQAAVLSFGDYELKHHNLEIMKRLPPLETMDALLFELLGAGLIVLSLAIGTGFIFLDDIRGPGLVHHTVITLAAWIVFAVLIWGRVKLGWRGAIASRWTLSGFALLALGYFGSKLVMEVILGGV